MEALIDGDIVAYRAACSCEKIPTLVELAAMGKDIDDRESLIQIEPVEIALLRVEDILRNILLEVGADSYKVFISGEHDFRVKVNPEYKANRKDLRRPKHLQACNEYMVTEWQAIVTDGIEADDALGIEQTESERRRLLFEPNAKDWSMICSIDKDLLQIPGQHYNFVKKEFSTISYIDGQRNLYKQMLIGDTADNIFGVKGIGKVGANNIIDPLNDEELMYNTVYDLYNDHERFEMNLKCLTILTKEPHDKEIN